MAYLSKEVSTHMRQDIFANMMRLPVGFYDKNQTGDIISVITYDVDTVNTTISADAVQILQSIVTVTVSFIMMLTIAPVLVLIFCVTVPLTFLFSKWYAGWTRKLFRERSRKLGALNGFVEEMLTAHSTTCAYGREDAPETLSAGLFDALRELDDPTIGRVYARCPEGGGIAYAVQNRLKKAAAFHIVNAEVAE